MPRKHMMGVDSNNQRIINVADPSAATDAATKQYVDSVAAGRDWKESVRVATTANLNLASPGSTINGVTMAANDRVLVKNQTTGSENGIYVWNGAAVAMTRAVDADSSADLTSGATVAVNEGTVDGDTRWTLTTNDPLTLGTTALTWSKDAGGGNVYVAGAGLTESPAGTFNVGAGTGVSVAADAVSIDSAVVVRKYAVAIGNGSLSTIAVTHNLGTRDITFTIYNATTYEVIDTDAVITDANTLTLTFPTAPTSGQFRVVVHS